MKSRIRQLEDQLSKVTQKTGQVPLQTPDSHLETPTSDIAAAFTAPQKRRWFDQADIIRPIMYKTRLFGRSHWMNGAIQVGS